ncbi:MAG: ABC transporter ATP-binding protein [bacterium JZ-2024 1]
MLEVHGLKKRFGKREVLKGISFEVKEGDIVGFLGPNGAGKTTTMRILMGYLSPSEGTARVAGFDVQTHPIEVKKRAGYMPENPPLYPEMTVGGFLSFVARLKRVPPRERKQRIDEVVEQVGIGDVLHRMIGHLSRGYRQRVGLAQALIHHPQVLILDEPTAGLDPKQIHDIRQLITQLGKKRTVLISTHILPEVVQTCNRAIIINEGQILAQDSLENLTRTWKGRIKVLMEVRRNAQNLLREIEKHPGVASASLKDNIIEVEMEAGRDVREELSSLAVHGNYGLVDFHTQHFSLEEVYLKLVTEEPQ